MKLFANKTKLRFPLGRWLYVQKKLQRNWLYYYEETKEELFYNSEQTIKNSIQRSDGDATIKWNMI